MSGRSTKREGKHTQRARSTVEVVDPRWLLKAFAVTLMVALLCSYVTLCVLFYQGQWQLVLHPTRTSTPPQTVAGVSFQVVRFDAGATGVPQLTGWWIPADASSSTLTALYLPGAEGSLAGDQPRLAELHAAGVAIFAIDYRGYGQSAALRPSQASMTADVEAAWQYLASSRGLPSEQIVPYGTGVGAALALELASIHRSSAVILDQPDFDVEERVRRDPRSKLVPVDLMFHDRFSLLPLLNERKIPKLIISRGDHENPAVLKAADPKMTVTFPASASGGYVPAVRRFLDQYAPPARPSPLMPTPAPSPQNVR